MIAINCQIRTKEHRKGRSWPRQQEKNNTGVNGKLTRKNPAV
jgi:hypothetical protein